MYVQYIIGMRVIVLILPIIGAQELPTASNEGGGIVIVSAYVIYDTEMSFLLFSTANQNKQRKMSRQSSKKSAAAAAAAAAAEGIVVWLAYMYTGNVKYIIKHDILDTSNQR